jgi:DNA-binding transcriptional LysR family regulator
MNGKVDVSDWADLRVFLAINDSQNLLAASDQLGMSQPTVGRRLTAFEKRLGVNLFARTGRRMQLTDAGNAILESARKMEREMNAIMRTVEGQAEGLCGEVTISATEGTGSQWLIPVLASLREKYPDISIQLNIDFRAADLLGREADIALRMGRPTQMDLIARKLTDIDFGIYASREYINKVGAVTELKDLEKLSWIRGLFGSTGQNLLLEFMSAKNLDCQVGMNTNSPAAQLAAVGEGIGAAIVSHRWAATVPNIVNLLPDILPYSVELWLVCHEDLRHSARIKAVADHIAEAATDDKGLFSIKSKGY